MSMMTGNISSQDNKDKLHRNNTQGIAEIVTIFHDTITVSCYSRIISTEVPFNTTTALYWVSNPHTEYFMSVSSRTSHFLTYF